MRKIFCDICERETERRFNHVLSLVIYKSGQEVEYQVGFDDTCDDCRKALILKIKAFIITKGVQDERD